MGGHIRYLDRPKESAYFFADTYKGFRRLNIVAHSDQIDNIVLIQRRPNDFLLPEELGDYLNKSHIDIEAYKTVRPVACSAGSGGTNAYAQHLATYLNKPVKAYRGPVHISADLVPAHFYETFYRPISSLADGFWRRRLASFNRKNITFLIDKSRDDYAPIHFIPMPFPGTPPPSP